VGGGPNGLKGVLKRAREISLLKAQKSPGGGKPQPPWGGGAPVFTRETRSLGGREIPTTLSRGAYTKGGGDPRDTSVGAAHGDINRRL